MIEQYTKKKHRILKQFCTMIDRQQAARLAYASEEMQKDREVVLAAVRHEGTMLQFSSGADEKKLDVFELLKIT